MRGACAGHSTGHAPRNARYETIRTDGRRCPRPASIFQPSVRANHPQINERESKLSNETIITVVGNLTDAPELRFTPSGAAVASFTVASTPRTFDKATSEWKDGDTLFMRCSIWREAAENVAESLTKGTRVIVQGRLVQRSFETREGEKRTVVEMQVDEVGPALRFVTATLSRSRAAHSGQQHQGSTGGWGTWNAPRGGQPDDPWATGEAMNTANDEPPF